MVPRTFLVPRKFLATAAILLVGGTTAAMAETYVVESGPGYVVERGYVETAPVYGPTVIVPAAPTIAAPPYVAPAPRTVVVEPRADYTPVPRRTYGYSSIRYAEPYGCTMGADGFCY